MWRRSTKTQAEEEERECSPWDVHGGLAGGSRGPGPGFAALGAVKYTIKVPYPQLFRLFRFINLC